MDLCGTAVVLEEFGRVIARGGSGVVISSQSGHRLPALTIEQNKALAMTPTERTTRVECGFECGDGHDLGGRIRHLDHGFATHQRSAKKRVHPDHPSFSNRGNVDHGPISAMRAIVFADRANQTQSLSESTAAALAAVRRWLSCRIFTRHGAI